MKALIMAAGRSTRTYPLTLTRPKPLLKLVNKTILEHQLDALSGIVDGVVLVVGYRKEMIQHSLGDDYRGISIQYVEQTEQRGTGHAVLQAAGLIDEPFLAMNGDDLYDPDDLASLARARQAALVKTVPDPSLYGIYELADGDRVVRLVEKPQPDQIFSNIANIGAYKFTPDVFAVLETVELSPRGEIEITSAVQALADTSDFRVVQAQGYWLAIGYPWHLLEANAFLLEHRPDWTIEGQVSPAAHIDGPVGIGPGTVVRPGVVIDGPVLVGRDCTIGPNAHLRPGATIGDRCRVGQAVEVKNSILMDGATVAHLTYIGDSVVGQDANIGCGTVTANLRHDGANVMSMVSGKLIDTGRKKLGAMIADCAHTGIHTSLYPGRKLWPNVTTRPGQIVDTDIVT